MKLEIRKIDGYEARVWEDERGNAWYEQNKYGWRIFPEKL